MTKKKVSTKTKKRLVVFGTFSVVFIFLFLFSLLYNIYTIYDLRKDEKKLQNSYLELQEQAEQLKKDIEKLNDENYLADYAREHYSYSKDGEYVLKIDDDEEYEEEPDNISIKIDKKYIIVGVAALSVLIIICIRANKK